jgi:hypothetical protein
VCNAKGIAPCKVVNGMKVFSFPAGIFEIDEQLLVPQKTSITGAKPPNDITNPTKSPNWDEQTLFLATRGATNYSMNYCHAKDMVTTRVGFVLSSYVSVSNVSYQGIDTIRPDDNGGLCGGGVFETKGCAENNCKTSNVNNAGSDGIGSNHVTIRNIRLNDFYYAQDKHKVGKAIPGNYECKPNDENPGKCCFCKPNGIRSSQVGVWVPQTRNAEGTSDLFVSNVVSRSTQADGVNLHGNVHDVVVQNSYFENSGDDIYVLWGADLNPGNVTFKDSTAVNPGILRPNWYGNCAATYGLESVVFENITCKAPTLAHPIPAPGDGSLRIDMSMYIFFTSFGASYPAGNNISIKGWSFEDLEGNTYTPQNGTMGKAVQGKMAWTKADADKGGIDAPFYFPSKGQQQVNVYVSQDI